MPPYSGIIRRFQAKLPDVICNMALSFEESGESGWQLMINDEFHAPVSTTWSA